MGKFQDTFINFALGGLLIICIFSFAVVLQQDNNASEQITDIPILNDTFSTLKSDLSSTRDTSQNQLNVFESEEPTTGFGSLILFSIVSSGRVFTGVIIGTFNLLIKLPMIIFGIDPVISSVLSTILIIIMILGLWVLYKLGG